MAFLSFPAKAAIQSESANGSPPSRGWQGGGGDDREWSGDDKEWSSDNKEWGGDSKEWKMVKVVKNDERKIWKRKLTSLEF